MKTKNMPFAKYKRRVKALANLNVALKSDDYFVNRYANSPMGQHEVKTLRKRIGAFAESGKRPSKEMRPNYDEK